MRSCSAGPTRFRRALWLIGILACTHGVLACTNGGRRAEPSIEPAPVQAHPENTMTFPPLPADPATPTLEQVADALAAGFSPDDRARARDLLAQILPWQLRDLAIFPAPRRLVVAVHDGLTTRLGPVPVAGRLDALAVIACEVQADKLLAHATGLGVARYLLDHPDRTAPPTWSQYAQPHRTLDRAALRAAAARVRADIDARLAAATGDCREAMRIPLLQAGLVASSAATGSFATSAGAFIDFLRDMGESPAELDEH